MCGCDGLLFNRCDECALIVLPADVRREPERYAICEASVTSVWVAVGTGELLRFCIGGAVSAAQRLADEWWFPEFGHEGVHEGVRYVYALPWAPMRSAVVA